MRAEVGDQLVGPGRTIDLGELLGTVVEVHGVGGRPPYTVRWHDDGSESKLNPDRERYWIRSHRINHQVQVMAGSLHRVPQGHN